MHTEMKLDSSSYPAGIAADITAMILTFNEEPNIARTLAAVAWVREVLIVDSGSTDATLAIASLYGNVKILTRQFDSFAEQCNAGLAEITTRWVMSMDADYELTDELAFEIQNLAPTESISGYRVQFGYRIYGRSLRATLYPPRTVLYRPERAVYHNEGHGHRVTVAGQVRQLAGTIQHDDRKPLARWLSSQQLYARREADYLMMAGPSELKPADRIRKMGWPAPVLVLLYTLFWKRCVLDGWAGWLYAMQRLFAETLIAIEIIDRRLRNTSPASSQGREK
jgi:glycosyltransferase involved in cell wall biosynthesis